MHPYYMPHLMGGCTKDRSKRSAIFDRATTRTFSRTPAIAGNRKTWSWSGWIKRGTLGILSGIFGASVGNATYYFWAYFDTDDRLKLGQFGAATTTQLSTTAVYRDPSAWMHILIVCDTTQATASERLRLYVNGQRITSFTAETYAAQNTDLVYNSTIPHRLGSGIDVDGGLYNAITCNMAEVHFTDGIVLQPANVGATDWRSSNWMHKHFAGDHGAQGYYLPFQGDAGDAPATASEAAKDRAPITGAHVAPNNWTANNFAASDFVKDTPTNYKSGTDHRGNFAVLSPVDKRVGQGTISNGNLQIAATTTNPHRTRSTFSLPSAGKYIFSVELRAGASLLMAGMMRSDLSVSDASPNLGLRAGEVGYLGNGGEVFKDNVLQGTFSTITTVGHHVVFAVDMTGNRAWVGKWDGANLVWFGGGDPAAGTLPTIASLPTGTLFPCVAPDTGITLKAWFGAQGFPFASPAGFTPLCVSALPKSSFLTPASAFAQALDTGANISAALAAKRTGWTNYVDVFKRNDSAEDTYFRFGDDAANAFRCPTGGKIAFPALAGTQYRARSLRVGTQYGVATGVVAHAGGAPTPVNDGMSTTRKVVILFPEAGGNIPVYHPDLTAGKLVYLNSLSVETTAGDIANVTASTFDIGAAMPAGNYRWLVYAHTPGLINIFKVLGNANVDGTNVWHGFAAGELTLKRIDSANDWGRWQSIVSPQNPLQLPDRFNLTSVPVSGGVRLFDRLATSTKARVSDPDTNTGTLIGIAIAEFPFTTGDCAAQATAR